MLSAAPKLPESVRVVFQREGALEKPRRLTVEPNCSGLHAHARSMAHQAFGMASEVRALAFLNLKAPSRCSSAQTVAPSSPCRRGCCRPRTRCST
jgi:hypothetical protein